MVDPFTIVIQRLRDLGFFQFLLPFMLSSAIFYGLLRRAQIFGDPDRNVAVNAVVSLMIAFMIWAAPIIIGINIEVALARFFTQGLIGSLIVIFGLMIVSIVFEKGLAATLSEKWKSGWLYVAILLLGLLGGIALLVTSGLMEVFFPSGVGLGALPQDIMLTVGVIILMVITVVAITAVGGAGAPKEEKKV